MSKKEQNKVIRKDHPQIEFDPIGHIYSVNGKILPSVSQIMKPMTEMKYSGISGEVLKKASDRGTRVHEAVEMFDQFGIEPSDEDIHPYLLSYKMAKQLEGLYSLRNEIRLTNEEFCGTIDIIAQIKGKTFIVDIKATSQINFDLLEVQLAGYHELAKHNGYEIEGCYVLHLKKGGYKFVQIYPNFALWDDLKKRYHENAKM